MPETEAVWKEWRPVDSQMARDQREEEAQENPQTNYGLSDLVNDLAANARKCNGVSGGNAMKLRFVQDRTKQQPSDVSLTTVDSVRDTIKLKGRKVGLFHRAIFPTGHLRKEFLKSGGEGILRARPQLHVREIEKAEKQLKENGGNNNEISVCLEWQVISQEKAPEPPPARDIDAEVQETKPASEQLTLFKE